ncbi:hypothetical protein [Limosilactobacillus antri]|uniref:hypothetical protein n=1 Tax=Limosilactobacillus antri TaxID=227943 RepID=UPI001F56DA79|nr:hypothetical protein [Limosilactobacillus antri]
MKYMQGETIKDFIKEEKEDIESWSEALKRYTPNRDDWALEDKEYVEQELAYHQNILSFLENFELLSQYNDEGEELYVNHANHKFFAAKPGTYFVLWIEPADVEKWLDQENLLAPLDTDENFADHYIKEYKAMDDFDKLVARVKFNYKELNKYTVPHLVDPLKKIKERQADLPEPLAYVWLNR